MFNFNLSVKIYRSIEKYTEPYVNLRDLNDHNSACCLNKMDKTIESIAEDIINEIHIILKDKSNNNEYLKKVSEK